uniref:IGFBP N-terminal domain-containing protein n=1 Tax=Rhabditophanes sp. KR3021 TaxID=114890 RepID=A0AC35TTF3_9BILA
MLFKSIFVSTLALTAYGQYGYAQRYSAIGAGAVPGPVPEPFPGGPTAGGYVPRGPGPVMPPHGGPAYNPYGPGPVMPPPMAQPIGSCCNLPPCMPQLPPCQAPPPPPPMPMPAPIPAPIPEPIPAPLPLPEPLPIQCPPCPQYAPLPPPVVPVPVYQPCQCPPLPMAAPPPMPVYQPMPVYEPAPSCIIPACVYEAIPMPSCVIPACFRGLAPPSPYMYPRFSAFSSAGYYGFGGNKKGKSASAKPNVDESQESE